PVPYVDLTFNQAVDAATFDATDVAVTGPGGAVAVQSVTALSSVSFRINFAQPLGAVGTYTLTVGPDVRNTGGGQMDQNNNGVPGEAADSLINVFTVTAPRIFGVTPAGAVQPPIGSVRVTYNKPMQTATFSAADLVSFTGPGGADLLP